MNRLACVATVLILALLVSAAGAEPLPEGTYYVQVRSVPVKSKPLGFTPTVTMLEQGAKVEVVGPSSSGYVPVRLGDGRAGFVLQSSLVTKERYQQIQTASAGAKEVGEGTAAYGAAKGWDKATELEYAKGKNLDAQFRLVDRIVEGPYPGRTVTELESLILEFASQGRLGEAALVQ